MVQNGSIISKLFKDFLFNENNLRLKLWNYFPVNLNYLVKK